MGNSWKMVTKTRKKPTVCTKKIRPIGAHSSFLIKGKMNISASGATATPSGKLAMIHTTPHHVAGN
jgi:hypothetical protein